jgi:hypothetical protein
VWAVFGDTVAVFVKAPLFEVTSKIMTVIRAANDRQDT